MRSRLSGLASSSAGLGRTGRRFANRPEALAEPEQALLRTRRVGVGGVPLRPADRREHDRVGAAAGLQHLVGERRPVGVDGGAADQVLLELEIADRGQQLARRGRDLRSYPVAGKRCDVAAPRRGNASHRARQPAPMASPDARSA